MVFYNDNDKRAVATLREMIAAGLIGEGVVDDRDIASIQPRELDRYDRVHLFAGIGGFEIAARLAGWPASVQLWTGGFPCFAAGTMVLTDTGYRPIEDVAVGDLVLTHLGRWKPVTSVMARDGAELVCVRAQGVPGVITTREHPFFARTYRERFPYLSDGKRGRERVWSEPKWTDASALTNRHVIGQVLPPIDRTSEGSDEFWWLVGRYLADGWRVKRNDRGPDSGRVVICCAAREAHDVAERIASAGFNATRSDERTVVKFHIVSCHLYRFLEKFGHKAHGKTLPVCALSLDQQRSAALLNGYLSGDGYRDIRAGSRRATTVSKSLALCVALLAQRAFGVVASVRRCAMPSRATIEGREVNQRDFFVVSIPDRNRSAFIEGDYGWKLVRRVELCGIGRVFNISVADDESYCADGAVVHNCQPFSVAGRGEGARDDRYLWPEFERLIRGCRPEYLLIENVAAIDAEPDLVLDRVLADLEAIGYETWTAEIPACAIDAAHLRNRVWIMAHRSGERRDEISETSTPIENDVSGKRSTWPMAHANDQGLQERGIIRSDTDAQRPAAERGDACFVGDAVCASPHTHPTEGPSWTAVGEPSGWVACHDGKARRVPLRLLDPSFVLASPIPSRSAALHLLGNSIAPPVAAEIMKAMLP